jgi:serine/threonine protein kinase
MVENDLTNQVFLSKFKAIKRLGNGSFGVVYKGVKNNSDENVAIKFVNMIINKRN